MRRRRGRETTWKRPPQLPSSGAEIWIQSFYSFISGWIRAFLQIEKLEFWHRKKLWKAIHRPESQTRYYINYPSGIRRYFPLRFANSVLLLLTIYWRFQGPYLSPYRLLPCPKVILATGFFLSKLTLSWGMKATPEKLAFRPQTTWKAASSPGLPCLLLSSPQPEHCAAPGCDTHLHAACATWGTQHWQAGRGPQICLEALFL